MKKILSITLFGVLISCSYSGKDFLLTNDSLGKIHKDTTIKQLDSIFAQDSIVKSAYEYTNKQKISVYKKAGELLLEITPSEKGTIEAIQVLDDRYTTSEGISLKSTFGDIRKKYPNLELDQTFKSLVIAPSNCDFYFIIDKSEVHKPALGFSDKITLDDIPNQAPIKYIMLNW